MDFNVNGIMDMIEKRLGSFIGTLVLILVVLAVAVYALRFVINEALFPLLSVLERTNVKEVDSWSMANVLFVVLLFLMVIGFAYLAVALNKNRKTLKILRESDSKSTELLNVSMKLYNTLKEQEVKGEGYAKQGEEILEKIKERAKKYE